MAGAGERCTLLKSGFAAVGHLGVVACALAGGDDLVVGIVVGVVDVGLVLDDWIVPAVVDAEGDKVDLLAADASGGDLAVLALEVSGKFWTVVS